MNVYTADKGLQEGEAQNNPTRGGRVEVLLVSVATQVLVSSDTI